MLDESVIRSREAKQFEEHYLRKGVDNQLSVIRIPDSRREEFHLSKAYANKIDVINVVTAPEIEMLIIHNEGAYERFKHSGKKPREYFADPATLVRAIKEYRRVANISNGEYTLMDLLKESN